MKFLLILIVLLGLAHFFFYDNGFDRLKSLGAAHNAAALQTPGPAQAAGPANPADAQGGGSFDGVTALLRRDMDAIPVALDGPGHPPANAQAIKRKVSAYLNLHQEYLTLTQACDLIIAADAQRGTAQSTCHAEQSRASFGGTLNGNGAMDHAVPASGHALATEKSAQGAKLKADQEAIHQRAESAWGSYRTRTAEQVQQLLASLAGKHI